MGLHRVKMGVSILMALAISTLLMRYAVLTGTPKFDFLKAKAEMGLSILSIKNSITTPIEGLFVAQNIAPTSIPIPTDTPSNSPSVGFEKAPTKNPAQLSIAPTSSPQVVPTSSYIEPTVRVVLPTTIPKPSNVPASTPIPVPTRIPIGLVRPQKNLDEVLAYVGKESCVPKNLFLAISQIENGLKFKNLDEKKFTLYNTFNWWNKDGTTEQDLYFAQAYNSWDGNIPLDSKFPGQHVAQGIDPYDMKIMGPVPISEQEFNAYKDRVIAILGQTTIDRRIILDSHLILGLHLKNISTYRGSDCNNWELKYVAKAACKYLGKCTYNVFGNAGNYCIRACNNYNQYAGTNYNCDSIPSMISDDGKCTLY